LSLAVILSAALASCGDVSNSQTLSEVRSYDSTATPRAPIDGEPRSIPMLVLDAPLVSVQSMKAVCCLQAAAIYHRGEERIRVVTETIDGTPTDQSGSVAVEMGPSNATVTSLADDVVTTAAIYSPMGEARLKELADSIARQGATVSAITRSLGFAPVESETRQVATSYTYTYLVEAGTVVLQFRPFKSISLEVASGSPLADIHVVDGHPVIEVSSGSPGSNTVTWMVEGGVATISGASIDLLRELLPRIRLVTYSTGEVGERITKSLEGGTILATGETSLGIATLRDSPIESELPSICIGSGNLHCSRSVEPPAIASLMIDSRWLLVASAEVEQRVSTVGEDGEVSVMEWRDGFGVLDLGSRDRADVYLEDAVLGSRTVVFERPVA
jgi:hypothetical protein